MSLRQQETSTFQEFTLAKGLRLLVAATPKFKRTRVSLVVHDRLDPDRASLGALLPFVQKRGTKSHPSGMALERAAGALYDADLSGSVYKVGDTQLLVYSLDIVSDRYVDRPIFRDGLDLLREMTLEPVQADGGLDPDYVQQEKRFQIGRLRALVNNKIAYARHRCVEEMFKGLPFAQHELGSEEGISQASPQSLYRHHQSLFSGRPVDVYVVGDVDPEEVRSAVAKSFTSIQGAESTVPKTQVSLGEGELRTVIEEENMNQGWLVLGLRTDVARCDPARYGMLFFNGILGGFVHSKLFVNVREKASLAYSASSSYNANKGLVLAGAGIDVKKYEQALEITRKQFEDTVAGKYTDEELEATRRALLSQYRLRLDSQDGRILYHAGGTVEGCPSTIEEALADIENTTRRDIAQAAERIRLDMIYFLKGVMEG